MIRTTSNTELVIEARDRGGDWKRVSSVTFDRYTEKGLNAAYVEAEAIRQRWAAQPMFDGQELRVHDYENPLYIHPSKPNRRIR